MAREKKKGPADGLPSAGPVGAPGPPPRYAQSLPGAVAARARRGERARCVWTRLVLEFEQTPYYRSALGDPSPQFVAVSSDVAPHPWYLQSSATRRTVWVPGLDPLSGLCEAQKEEP